MLGKFPFALIGKFYIPPIFITGGNFQIFLQFPGKLFSLPLEIFDFRVKDSRQTQLDCVRLRHLKSRARPCAVRIVIYALQEACQNRVGTNFASPANFMPSLRLQELCQSTWHEPCTSTCKNNAKNFGTKNACSLCKVYAKNTP